MKVFISWSGDRSKAVADALYDWLSQVIQAVEPWLSADIDKGARWTPEIANNLEESKAGIICLTKDNLNAPWILFEAGALSKAKDAHVCTFLLDLSPAEVSPPLGQFQHTSRTEDDVRRLVKTINDTVAKAGERALKDGVLDQVFDRWWPELSSKLDDITKSPAAAAKSKRSDREVLEEVLEIVRTLDRRIDERPELGRRGAGLRRLQYPKDFEPYLSLGLKDISRSDTNNRLLEKINERLAHSELEKILRAYFEGVPRGDKADDSKNPRDPNSDV